jgi:hypothetical protein
MPNKLTGDASGGGIAYRSDHMSSLPVFSGVGVTRTLVYMYVL